MEAKKEVINMGFLDKPVRPLPLAPDIHWRRCDKCKKGTKQSFKGGHMPGGVYREWTCLKCGYVES